MPLHAALQFDGARAVPVRVHDGSAPARPSSPSRAALATFACVVREADDADGDVVLVDAAPPARVYRAAGCAGDGGLPAGLTAQQLTVVPGAAGAPPGGALYEIDATASPVVVGYRVVPNATADASGHPRHWVLQAAHGDGAGGSGAFFDIDVRADVRFAPAGGGVEMWLGRPVSARRFRLVVRGVRGAAGERGGGGARACACRVELLCADDRGADGGALASGWGWRLLLIGPAGQRRLRLVSTDRAVDAVTEACVPTAVGSPPLRLTVGLVSAEAGCGAASGGTCAWSGAAPSAALAAAPGGGDGEPCGARFPVASASATASAAASAASGARAIAVSAVMLLDGLPLRLCGYRGLLLRGAPHDGGARACGSDADAAERPVVCPCECAHGRVDEPATYFGISDDDGLLQAPQPRHAARACVCTCVRSGCGAAAFVDARLLGSCAESELVAVGGPAFSCADAWDAAASNAAAATAAVSSDWIAARRATDCGAAGEGRLAADAAAFPSTRLAPFVGEIRDFVVMDAFVRPDAAAALAAAAANVQRATPHLPPLLQRRRPPTRMRDAPLSSLEHVLLWRPNAGVDAAVRAGTPLRPRYSALAPANSARGESARGCWQGVGHGGPLSLVCHDCGPAVYVEDAGGTAGDVSTAAVAVGGAGGAADAEESGAANARLARVDPSPAASASTARRPARVAQHHLPRAFADADSRAGSPTVGHAYRLRHWAHVDVFVYFSHARVSIPPAGWVAAAHTHGVRVLGTLVTEWAEGEAANLMLMLPPAETSAAAAADGDGGAPLATGHGAALAAALARLAAYYGFDGWLVNVEAPVRGGAAGARAVCNWVSALTTAVHAGDGGSDGGRGEPPYAPGSSSGVDAAGTGAPRSSSGLVLWYDGVDIASGAVRWASALTDANDAYLRACDGLFLDYHWPGPEGLATTARRAAAVGTVVADSGSDVHPAPPTSHLSDSAGAAASRARDIFVGIDVWGRGCWGGGGWNCGVAVDAAVGAAAAAAATVEAAAGADGASETCADAPARSAVVSSAPSPLPPPLQRPPPLSVAVFGAAWAYEAAGGARAGGASSPSPFESTERRWWVDGGSDDGAGSDDGGSDDDDDDESGVGTREVEVEVARLAVANASGECGVPAPAPGAAAHAAAGFAAEAAAAFGGWTVVEAGGDGWGVAALAAADAPPLDPLRDVGEGDVPPALPTHCFVTSHRWCRAALLLPLPASLLQPPAANAADGADAVGTSGECRPTRIEVTVSEWYRGTAPNVADAYYLTATVVSSPSHVTVDRGTARPASDCVNDNCEGHAGGGAAAAPPRTVALIPTDPTHIDASTADGALRDAAAAAAAATAAEVAAGDTVVVMGTTGVLTCGPEWRRAVLPLAFALPSASAPQPSSTLWLRVEHGGVDAEGWAGRYGARMCGVAVTVGAVLGRRGRSLHRPNSMGHAHAQPSGVGVKLPCPRLPVEASDAAAAVTTCSTGHASATAEAPPPAAAVTRSAGLGAASAPPGRGPFAAFVGFAPTHGVRPVTGALPFSTNFCDGVGAGRDADAEGGGGAPWVRLFATQPQPSFAGRLATERVADVVSGPCDWVRGSGSGSGESDGATPPRLRPALRGCGAGGGWSLGALARCDGGSRSEHDGVTGGSGHVTSAPLVHPPRRPRLRCGLVYLPPAGRAAALTARGAAGGCAAFGIWGRVAVGASHFPAAGVVADVAGVGELTGFACVRLFALDVVVPAPTPSPSSPAGSACITVGLGPAAVRVWARGNTSDGRCGGCGRVPRHPSPAAVRRVDVVPLLLLDDGRLLLPCDSSSSHAAMPSPLPAVDAGGDRGGDRGGEWRACGGRHAFNVSGSGATAELVVAVRIVELWLAVVVSVTPESAGGSRGCVCTCAGTAAVRVAAAVGGLSLDSDTQDGLVA